MKSSDNQLITNRRDALNALGAGIDINEKMTAKFPATNDAGGSTVFKKDVTVI